MSSKKIKAAENISGQMALQLPVENFVTRQDLVEGQANSLALELIDGWPDWPGLVVVLAGPVGSGKSHIGAAWVRKADARCVSMSNLDELGEDRANQRPLLLEDAKVNCIEETELLLI